MLSVYVGVCVNVVDRLREGDGQWKWRKKVIF